MGVDVCKYPQRIDKDYIEYSFTEVIVHKNDNKNNIIFGISLRKIT